MTPNKTFLRCAAGPALAAFAFLAQANTIPGGVAPEERMLVEQGYGGFLTAHPDLRHNKRGLTAFLDGDYEKAARSFRLAARYADKPSQALIAEMLWEGKGSAQDRPLAYAWADLAAERGERRLVLQREHYWEQMSESERALAIERGEAVYAEFGDAVAQPRLARVLRRASRNLERDADAEQQRQRDDVGTGRRQGRCCSHGSGLSDFARRQHQRRVDPGVLERAGEPVASGQDFLRISVLVARGLLQLARRLLGAQAAVRHGRSRRRKEGGGARGRVR